MKKGTLLRIGVAGLLVVGGLSLISSTLVPPVYTISSEIVLPASQERSWAVLTDFAQYPDWNPYLTRIEGTLAADETVSFTLVDGNFSQPLDLSARVAFVQANEQFYWVGTALVPGIYDTRHVFRLKQQVDGGTTLLHFEEFRGILPALLPAREERNAHTRRAFQSMNQALQQRLINNGAVPHQSDEG